MKIRPMLFKAPSRIAVYRGAPTHRSRGDALKRALGIAIAVMAAGCGARTDPAVGDCATVMREYVRSNEDQWSATGFTSRDFETQYRIYICANQFGEPPMIGYAVEEFASEGEEAAGFLKEKLRNTEFDRTTTAILRVFVEMKRAGTFDASQDDELMQIIDRRTEDVSDRHIRPQLHQWIAEIRAQPRDDEG